MHFSNEWSHQQAKCEIWGTERPEKNDLAVINNPGIITFYTLGFLRRTEKKDSRRCTRNQRKKPWKNIAKNQISYRSHREGKRRAYQKIFDLVKRLSIYAFFSAIRFHRAAAAQQKHDYTFQEFIYDTLYNKHCLVVANVRACTRVYDPRYVSTFNYTWSLRIRNKTYYCVWLWVIRVFE